MTQGTKPGAYSNLGQRGSNALSSLLRKDSKSAYEQHQDDSADSGQKALSRHEFAKWQTANPGKHYPVSDQ